jgi:hypothetical protein
MSPDEQGKLREPDGLDDRNPRESLQRALDTLSSIRQRYEVGRQNYPDARFYRVHFVVDRGDVAWLNATIEALENTIAAVATTAQTRPKA